jgi:hypothetical protein
LALAPFVDTVLLQHHENIRKQPHRLLFECRWRYRFFASQLVGQLVKVP